MELKELPIKPKSAKAESSVDCPPFLSSFIKIVVATSYFLEA